MRCERELLRWWTMIILQRTRSPVAVEAGRHAAREMGERDWSLGEVGCLEHREVAGLLLAAIEHAQQPAVALGRAVVARHEDRLAEAVVRAGRPARALAGLEVVVRQPVGARLAGPGIDDVARDDPAVAIVAHAVALVEAREFAGPVVELLLLEGVGL